MSEPKIKHIPGTVVVVGFFLSEQRADDGVLYTVVCTHASPAGGGGGVRFQHNTKNSEEQ